MPKFQKKPIIVEAHQHLAGIRPAVPGVTIEDDGSASIETANGCITLKDRDWVIKDVWDGLYYPCNPDIFIKLFTPVLEDLVESKDTKEAFPTEERCPKCPGVNWLSTNRKSQKWCNACGYGIKTKEK